MSTLESLYRTSGDYPIVWEVLFAYDQYHREYTPDGDSHPAGKSREQAVTHIVAPTLAAAKLAFAHNYPSHVNYEAVSFTPLCTINHTVTLQ